MREAALTLGGKWQTDPANSVTWNKVEERKTVSGATKAEFSLPTKTQRHNNLSPHPRVVSFPSLPSSSFSPAHCAGRARTDHLRPPPPPPPQRNPICFLSVPTTNAAATAASFAPSYEVIHAAAIADGPGAQRGGGGGHGNAK